MVDPWSFDIKKSIVLWKQIVTFRTQCFLLSKNRTFIETKLQKQLVLYICNFITPDIWKHEHINDAYLVFRNFRRNSISPEHQKKKRMIRIKFSLSNFVLFLAVAPLHILPKVPKIRRYCYFFNNVPDHFTLILTVWIGYLLYDGGIFTATKKKLFYCQWITLCFFLSHRSVWSSPWWSLTLKLTQMLLWWKCFLYMASKLPNT